MSRFLLGVLLVMLSLSCGVPVAGEPDAGAEDAGATDAGPADAGVPDAGQVDAGDLDAGVDGGLTLEVRSRAARETALGNPACSLSALPEGFYWEIGDRDGLLASGTVSGTDTPDAGQVIAIASSSKWIYSSYVLQKVGSVRAGDVPYLHFTSGEIFPSTSPKEVVCGATQTVGECAADVVKSPAATDHFYYSAGHFQYHATTVMNLGSLRAGELTTEVGTVLGPFDFKYLQTNLAGGLNASATGYAGFLRRMLRGEYVMAAHLGAEKICASAACASGAVLSPAPPDEAWNYSLGHWVEDDPQVGDHAFSSAGALGFYPWIDRTRTWYGVLARRAANPGGSQGVVSLRCGRLIRQAWVTGIATTDPTPHP